MDRSESDRREDSLIALAYGNRGGINFKANNDQFLMSIAGYFQVDTFRFFGDKHDRVNNAQNLENGVEIPRSRLIILGHVKPKWYYVFSHDFASGNLLDSFLEYYGFSHQVLRFGQYKPAYSISFDTSDRDVIARERPLPLIAFQPGFGLGYQHHIWIDHVAFIFGVYGPNTSNVVQGNTVSGDDPLAAHFRLFFVPVHHDRRIFHVGVASLFQKSDSARLIRFRTIPSIKTRDTTRLIDTGNISDSHDYHVVVLEAMGEAGPFNLQGEYHHAFLDRNHSPDLDFQGYYIIASVFLTGESRDYSYPGGRFIGITPVRHSYGAWQIFVSHSNLDLNDRTVRGGTERDSILGLNWYVNNNVRFTLEGIHSQACPASNGQHRHVNSVALRSQLAF